MNKLDEMVFDTKNDRWIFLNDLKSGEFMYNNKPIRVFTTDRGYKFFQTKWKNNVISSVSWENCKDVIKDRTENAKHYEELEQLNHKATAAWYNDKSFNYKGD